MEASILKEEEVIQSEKRKVEEEYAKKLRELEARSLQKRDQLVNVKEEVKRIQVKMEKEIDKELGVEEDYVGGVEYSDFEEGEQKPRMKIENQGGLKIKGSRKGGDREGKSVTSNGNWSRPLETATKSIDPCVQRRQNQLRELESSLRGMH